MHEYYYYGHWQIIAVRLVTIPMAEVNDATTQLLSSIKTYLVESGGVLPFKFTRLLSTIGPKLGVTKLKEGTMEHQQIMIFVAHLAEDQVSLVW